MKTIPVTASTLSASVLGDLVKEKYQLNENFSCKLFRTGMNHTYFLSTKDMKYVLRVYSYNWRSKSEIQEELKLLNLLKKNNLGVSFPIEDKDGGFIQRIKAPEGIRYAVLFSFAKGDKVRFINNETCYRIGSLMAKIHKFTSTEAIDRVSYDKKSLLELPYLYLNEYFSDDLPEMDYIKKIIANFKNSDFENSNVGVIHMDIWYDNMAITGANEITIFDFDFCGNGWRILDISYFCKQLFHIEIDKNEYELKIKSFLQGYQSINTLSSYELKLIPKAGLAVFIFYLGVQCQRFDWSNIFLSENYLKMYTNRMKSWTKYNKSNKISIPKHNS